jgi:hypothetical protein
MGGRRWLDIPERPSRAPDDPAGPAPDEKPSETDYLARSYANLRFECADLEDIIGAKDCGLNPKDLKRLDKAVTVMKVGFKIIARVLRAQGYETGRKRLEAAAAFNADHTPEHVILREGR